MTNNTDRAAEVIADALRPALTIADGIGRDLARILATAGVLADDLPAPTSYRGDGQPEWLVPGLAKIYVDCGIVVFELDNPDDEELTNGGAKMLALALLAAVNYAEKVMPE